MTAVSSLATPFTNGSQPSLDVTGAAGTTHLKAGGTKVVTEARSVNTTTPLSGGGALSSDLSLTLSTVPVAKGGLNLTSATQGDILYASGTDVWAKLPKAAPTPRVLMNTGTSQNPAWGQVDLSTGAVTGVLPKANLGTHNHSATGEGGATLAPTTLTLPSGTSPPTAAGSVYYESTKKVLTVGNGSTAQKQGFIESAQVSSYLSGGWPAGPQYGAWGILSTSSGSEYQMALAVPMACDEMTIRGTPDNTTLEAVTVTVRKNAAGTTLTATIDGDASSGACDGDATRECSSVHLSTPVTFALRDLAGFSIACAGANCNSTMTTLYISVRCWLTG